jgi:hypothetical protein
VKGGRINIGEAKVANLIRKHLKKKKKTKILPKKIGNGMNEG